MDEISVARKGALHFAYIMLQYILHILLILLLKNTIF